MINTQTNTFVAIGAVFALDLGVQKPTKPVLPSTNRFELGKLDRHGCFCTCPPPPCGGGKLKDTQWTVKNPGNGKADVDLGNYTLQMDEKNSQIKIINKANGEVTNIWGDPHVDWNKDGKTDVDFWGKTTFQLEDGTKITIDTEKYAKNPNMYVASEVTVTKGDNAMKITGLSQNELGDLKIETSDRGGQALDWATTDGFTVKENANGEGWINPDTGKLVTQKEMDITKPGTTKPYEFTQQFGQALGLYLLTGLFGGGLDLRAAADAGEPQPSRVRHEPPPVIKPMVRPHVHQPDANTVEIHQRNGGVDTRSGGTLAWRANNPALLPYNDQTRSLGAIGSVDGVAVFPNEDKGRSAWLKLLIGVR
ncbi:DUF1521 domain-containing protein [Ottowia sp. GY511]|uniref:DUF1521 domain-containing protein n=1 Tax=Ottowia flava TaxID=2675430 RepID=A0ABW4KY47_9BURK|nr:DUF1521 domain-containing protein [Ottowia sp. GY511]TXK31336.1 DUF1521 domain-containing protein [Ottowia sp. GY511]